MLFHVTLERAEDGWVVAECPALPGCVSLPDLTVAVDDFFAQLDPGA